MNPPRLIIVTGKGGTGKSTVAAALALALARRRPTILADLDQRGSAARLLGGRSARIELLTLHPRRELEAFVERIVPLGAIARRMLESRTFAYVTAALPGLEGFLMMERLRILAGDAALHDCYVVVDAPATGSALELLSVARGVIEIAPRGTLNRLAGNITNFLRDPSLFGVLLTLRPERLATHETIEAGRALEPAIGQAPYAVVLNGVTSPLFTSQEARLALGLQDGHGDLAMRRRAMSEAAASARAELGRLSRRCVELPMMFTRTIGAHEVHALSEGLARGLLDD